MLNSMQIHCSYFFIFRNIDLDAEEQTVTVLSNNIQWRALVIMLVSNAFGYSNVKSPELINLAEAR